MLCVETWNVAESMPQVSPERTVYRIGSNGVSVGMGVALGSSVPVGVIVAVAVGDTTAVGFCSLPPIPACKLKYTTAAPINKMITSAPNAAGNVSVISGMRLACTVESVFFDFVAAFAVSSVPHTKQRVAVSVRRVPQVGQICDF